VSGNLAGRRKGSRNRWRRADPLRAIKWTATEWKLHFARTIRTAQGDPGERAAAAYVDSQLLWRAHHRPMSRPGMCAQCGRALAPPNASLPAAPVPFDGAFVHHCCIREFAFARWHEAAAALSHFGISIDSG
jgi:hypothetical protein